MNNLEEKEKKLNELIEKLAGFTSGYSQSSIETEKIEFEKKQLHLEKLELEKKNQNLLKEHKYLKEKVLKLQLEVNKKSEMEEKFKDDIDELSQETENLVEEIDKWQM